MTDAISRKATAEWLKRYLDSWSDRHQCCYEIENEIPALDVVPVVRCNLCKYYEQDTGFCQYWGGGNHWNGFCNCGARMDGENEEET